jgi:HCOMODA/2-hydroxy-3-carboxy-muconic semialdehyde decarboxylase
MGMTRCAATLAIALLAVTARVGSQAPAAPSRETLVADLVTANRILANEGVVDGYGHVSVRNPASADRYFLARAGAPALVTAADIVEYDLDSTSISGNAPDTWSASSTARSTRRVPTCTRSCTATAST